MSFNLKDHVKQLTELAAPSGYEDAVRAYLRAEWASLVDTFEVDGLGSLIGIKRGSGTEPRKRIMLSAHMDEIAYMVAEVKEGYLRLSGVGGVDDRILTAKPVLVHTRERVLKGVVAAIPPHITRATKSADTYTALDDLWVDLGLPASEVATLVQIGDLVTYDAPALELAGDRIAGKTLDDRASVAAVTACLHYLKTRTSLWDIYAVASVQEEVNLQGATTSAYHIRPDIAIAIDVGFAQQSGVNGDEYVKLGKGPTISIGPNFHPGLVEGLKKAAKNIEMHLFVETMTGNSGTDAWAIQVSRQGVPTALLSIPLKNMHTPVEIVSLKDIERTGRLMAEFIAGLTEDYLDTLGWKTSSDSNNGNNANGNNTNAGEEGASEEEE